MTNYRRRKGDMVNADLWRKLDMLLASRPPGSVELTKVKGHATAEDALQGRVSRFDKFGNDAADELAVLGAIANPARKKQIESFRRNLHLTMQVQRMMVEIFAKQRQASTRKRTFDMIEVSSASSVETVSSTWDWDDLELWSEEPPD